MTLNLRPRCSEMMINPKLFKIVWTFTPKRVALFGNFTKKKVFCTLSLATEPT